MEWNFFELEKDVFEGVTEYLKKLETSVHKSVHAKIAAGGSHNEFFFEIVPVLSQFRRDSKNLRI
jgi:hypothetical protein